MPSLALSTLNSCLDPFIYYYVSHEFRDNIWAMLCSQPELLPGLQRCWMLRDCHLFLYTSVTGS